MSRLDLAEKRLAEALKALEQAAEKARSGKAESAKALVAERDRLLTRVARLEEELAALGSANQEVAGRLDGAISEIRAALARS